MSPEHLALPARRWDKMSRPHRYERKHVGHRDEFGAIGRYEARGSWPYTTSNKYIAASSVLASSDAPLLRS